MADLEFEVRGHSFKASSLAPKQAWHVVRRLSTAPSDSDALSNAFLTMSDEHSDFIIDTCLSVVKARIGEGRGWAPVMSGGQLMFDWITAKMMIEITFKVVEEAMKDFLDGEAQAS